VKSSAENMPKLGLQWTLPTTWLHMFGDQR